MTPSFLKRRANWSGERKDVPKYLQIRPNDDEAAQLQRLGYMKNTKYMNYLGNSVDRFEWINPPRTCQLPREEPTIVTKRTLKRVGAELAKKMNAKANWNHGPKQGKVRSFGGASKPANTTELYPDSMPSGPPEQGPRKRMRVDDSQPLLSSRPQDERVQHGPVPSHQDMLTIGSRSDMQFHDTPASHFPNDPLLQPIASSSLDMVRSQLHSSPQPRTLSYLDPSDWRNTTQFDATQQSAASSHFELQNRRPSAPAQPYTGQPPRPSTPNFLDPQPRPLADSDDPGHSPAPSSSNQRSSRPAASHYNQPPNLQKEALEKADLDVEAAEAQLVYAEAQREYAESLVLEARQQIVVAQDRRRRLRDITGSRDDDNTGGTYGAIGDHKGRDACN